MWRNKLVLMVYATLLGSLAFCLDSSSLPGAATTAGRIGRLIVGKGVRLASNETEPNNDGQVAGFADTEGYQSDQTVSRDERKLLYLNPSVHCGDDSMALHVKGTRMPNFMVDRGEEGSIPVSKMPSHCGYSVRRARRDVHIIIPYQGCNVGQQGDDYVLPLRLSGLPLQMSCPAAPFPSVPATAPAGPASDPQVLAYPSPPAYPPGPTGYSTYWVQSTPPSAATSPPQVLAYPFQPANVVAPSFYPPEPTGYPSYWVPLTSTNPSDLAFDPPVLGYPAYTWPSHPRPMHWDHWDHTRFEFPSKPSAPASTHFTLGRRDG